MTLHDKVVKRPGSGSTYFSADTKLLTLPEVVAHTRLRVSSSPLGETCENKKGIFSYLDEMPMVSVLLPTKS